MGDQEYRVPCIPKYLPLPARITAMAKDDNADGKPTQLHPPRSCVFRDPNRDLTCLWFRLSTGLWYRHEGEESLGRYQARDVFFLITIMFSNGPSCCPDVFWDVVASQP